MTFVKIILFSAIISIFLAACNPSESSGTTEPRTAVPEEFTPTTAAPTSDPTATVVPAATFTAEPSPEPVDIEASPAGEIQMPSDPEQKEFVIQPGIENITITGAGELPLQATLYTPGGSEPLPGVILLHMLGSDRQIWDDNGFAIALVENGYAVLTVDMRGHGETGSSIDWLLAPEDLRRVWEYFTSLEAVDPQHTALIGASIGSNLALQIAADQPAISTVILLSPGLDYRGVTTEVPLQQYGSRPILIVASEEDVYAADSSRTLTDLAQGESQLEMCNGAGHGTRMFNAQPELSSLLLTWLEQNLN